MTLGVGVIGAGVMGGLHARLLSEEIAGARLVAVSDPDEGRAQAASYGGKIFQKGMALIHCDAVDALILASPDAMHHELVMTALRLGKPVLCEKPLAATVMQCREIYEADSGQDLVSVGFMRRFDPCYREMKEALSHGAIGTPMLVRCAHRNRVAPSWFDGSMIISNAMVHEIDICRWLLGVEFTYVRLSSVGEAGDMILAELQTNLGIVISIEVFMNASYGYHVHTEIVGRDGTIAMAEPAILRLRREGAASAAYSSDWIRRFDESYRAQDQSWVRAVLHNRRCSEIASARDGLFATSYALQIADLLTVGGGTLKIPI